jgi:hypothetical protein
MQSLFAGAEYFGGVSRGRAPHNLEAGEVHRLARGFGSRTSTRLIALVRMSASGAAKRKKGGAWPPSRRVPFTLQNSPRMRTSRLVSRGPRAVNAINGSNVWCLGAAHSSSVVV